MSACVVDSYKTMKELFRTLVNVEKAAKDIPRSFRTPELESVIKEIEEINLTHARAILTNAGRIVDAIDGQPDKHSSTELRNAAVEFHNCVDGAITT